MKVATYNLEFLFDKGTHTHSGKEWNYTSEFVGRRIDYFAKAISDINADIVFLQELASESVLRRILGKVGEGYSYFIATPDVNGVGNAVIFKKEINCACTSIQAKSDHMPVFVEGDQDVIGPRIWSRRDFVFMKTIHEGKDINMLGVHVKSRFLVPQKTQGGSPVPMGNQIEWLDGNIRSELFRFSQVRKIREAIDSIFSKDPNAKVLIAGDLNCIESEVMFKMICGEKEKSERQLISTNHWLGEQDRISSNDKRVVDSILISKELENEVATFRILNEYIYTQEEPFDLLAQVGSDHAPLVIEFK